MPLGQFAMVATLLVMVMATLSQAMVKVGRLTTAGPSLRRAAAMLGDDAPEPVLTRANTTQLPDTPSIELADVSYLRTSGRAVFARLNLRIEAGEKVALMGATGSGKSTVLDLIMRLRTPYSGRILYSDIDVRELPQDLYYSAFGFVGQDNYLMQITVRAYLQQAWPNQTDDALWRVLALVKLERESRCLSLGLDTDLGTAGSAISPSQRARLSVARALLRDPQVLILDEFTARLDPEAQADLIADVLAQSKNRTVICSTNSPAVAALFERVIVLPGPGG